MDGPEDNYIADGTIVGEGELGVGGSGDEGADVGLAFEGCEERAVRAGHVISHRC